MCELIDDQDCLKAGKHRGLERADIRNSEEAVQRTIFAIKSFTNPCTLVDKDHLYCLVSGAPVSQQVADDVLHAKAAGKEAKQAFIQYRFMNGPSEALLFEPMKNLKLKTMDASNNAIKLNVSQGKVCDLMSSHNYSISFLQYDI